MMVEGAPVSWSDDVELETLKVREAALSGMMVDCGVARVRGGIGTV